MPVSTTDGETESTLTTLLATTHTTSSERGTTRGFWCHTANGVSTMVSTWNEYPAKAIKPRVEAACPCLEISYLSTSPPVPTSTFSYYYKAVPVETTAPLRCRRIMTHPLLEIVKEFPPGMLSHDTRWIRFKQTPSDLTR